MAKIASQLTELIGNTPLLELTNYEKELGLKAHIVAKLEYFNPLGSVKDRVAAAMIEQGIKDGLINQETVIIEPTSGNTGIGLAFVSAAKGLHLILTMPDTMSVERRREPSPRQMSSRSSMEMHSSHSSLRTRQILLSTRRQQQRRSGEIQTERLMHLYQQ